jgi:hypothetical protein
MTARQLILMTCLYLAALIVVALVTRASARRIAGALAGGAVVGLVALGIITLGEAQGWWRVLFIRTPGSLSLVYLGFAVSCAPFYLITWRVARRFGWRGLAVCIGVAAIIGPPRDYRFAATFPEWIVFAPGVAPVIAVAVTYAVIVGLGHAVMRLVAGPSDEDQLARRFWKAAA